MSVPYHPHCDVVMHKRALRTYVDHLSPEQQREFIQIARQLMAERTRARPQGRRYAAHAGRESVPLGHALKTDGEE